MIRYLFFAFIFLLGIRGEAGAQAPQKSVARDLYFAGLDDYKTGKIRPVSNTTPPPVAVRRSDPAATQATPQRKKGTTRSGAVDASVATPRTPLGLRYAVIRVQGTDSFEVPVNTVFRSGDRIRLKVEVNDEGYLYVVHRGTSGSWQVMFPNEKVASGSNRVQPGQSYDIPSGSAFRFTGEPGTERLFIVMSRKPEQALDRLIYDLRDDKVAAPEAQAPAPVKSAPMLMASNRVLGDPLVAQLRSATRDLVLETVVEDAPATASATPVASTRAQAVYVVNPAQRPDARIVADVSLVHR